MITDVNRFYCSFVVTFLFDKTIFNKLPAKIYKRDNDRPSLFHIYNIPARALAFQRNSFISFSLIDYNIILVKSLPEELILLAHT